MFPDRRFTFAELAAGASDFARSLSALGVRRGAHVGVLLGNCPELIFALFATQLLGAVLVPLNTRFRTRELAHAVTHADLEVLLTHDADLEAACFAARVQEAYPELLGASDPMQLSLRSAPKLRTVVNLGDSRRVGMISRADFDLLAESVEAVPGHRAGGPEIALMLYTSGTTALPKACMLSHEAIIGGWLCVGSRLGVGIGDRVFDPLPLFHMGGIGPLLFTVHACGTFIDMEHFEPEQALRLIEAERASVLYTMFPPLTMAMVRHPSFQQRDLSAVVTLMNVAPTQTLEVISQAFAPAIHMAGPFGMTEAGGAITCNSIDSAPGSWLDSTGPPVTGMEVRAVDPESGRALPAGAQGELVVRGRGLFSGYYKDPAASAAVIDEDGWLHSGDLGALTADGRVIYVGRLKEMLKVGGENVAPAEIEAHLSTHEAIKLVQVVAAPDERLGEVPAAFVELAPGRSLTEQDVVSYCEGRIASFKVPRHVRFVREWPMSATKVQKGRLAEQLLAELEHRSATP